MRGSEFPREIQLEGYNTANGRRAIWEHEGFLHDSVNIVQDVVFDIRREIADTGVVQAVKHEAVGAIESAVGNKLIFGAAVFVAGVGTGVILRGRQGDSS